MNAEYKKYLLSNEWASIKLDLFAIRGKQCEICGSKRYIQVHHKTYKNIFNENPEDLQVVCNSCHKNIHFPKKKKSKLAKRVSKKSKTTAKQSLVKKVKTKKYHKRKKIMSIKKLLKIHRS